MSFEMPNYTQTPNILFDKYMPLLKGSELKIILFIIRKTLGFVLPDGSRKTQDRISISQLRKGTGLQNAKIVEGIAALEVEYNLIETVKVPGKTTFFKLVFANTCSENETVDQPSISESETLPFHKVKQTVSESEKVKAETISQSENTKESNINKLLNKNINKKTKYLNFVYLFTEEYEELVNTYKDKALIDCYIRKLDNWLGDIKNSAPKRYGKEINSHKFKIISFMDRAGIPIPKSTGKILCPACLVLGIKTDITGRQYCPACDARKADEDWKNSHKDAI